MKLILDNVCKTIKNKTILNEISLEFESGNIYAIVGRNGSGKTMLLRAIAGLIRLERGEIKFNGRILGKDMEVIPNLGIVLENAGLYEEYTGYKNLELLAGINQKITEEQIKDSIVRVGLDPEDRRSFKKYSLGMKKRIVIAQAIMEKPDIILLDEPTNGLDEDGVELIRKIILEEKRRGALVLLASHSKEDIEVLPDEIIYIKDGKICKKEGVL